MSYCVLGKGTDRTLTVDQELIPCVHTVQGMGCGTQTLCSLATPLVWFSLSITYNYTVIMCD